MLRLKRNILLPCIAGIMAVGLTGCQKSPPKEDVIVAAPNDWAGGFSRVAKVQSDVMNTIKILDTQNYEIIKGNPTDYWSDDNFQYLHVVPMNSELLPCTAYFDETNDFAAIQEAVTAALTEKGYSVMNVTKIAPHHYSMDLEYHADSWRSFESVFKEKNVECIYDATHNWMQMSTQVEENFSDKFMEEELYEFVQLGTGVYALQNESERLYAVYEGNELSAFYYSVLPDVTKQMAEDYYRIEEEKAKSIEEIYQGIIAAENGSDKTAETVSENTDIGLHYTKANNSIFLDMKKCGPEWVAEAPELKTHIVYQNGELTVSVLNKLTGKQESFSVKAPEEEKADETVQDVSTK